MIRGPARRDKVDQSYARICSASRFCSGVVQSGPLTTSEGRALAAVEAAGAGTVLTLLRSSQNGRDSGLSAFMREVAIGAITRADAVLSAGERHLLKELLDRIAASA